METKAKCRSCTTESVENINVSRFIDKLDTFFKTNDLVGAGEHIKYWEKEAQKLNDKRGLLSVLNEMLGFSRRVKNKEDGLNAVNGVTALIEELGLQNALSSATILVNAGTTLKEFGEPTKAYDYYVKAQEIFEKNGKTDGYEYASLFNNSSATLIELGKIAEGEKALNKAIEILDNTNSYHAERALSRINLAHLIFDAYEDYERVESLLDIAWDLVCEDKRRDENYAFLISKIAPSLKYFKRETEAEALTEIANEIYRGEL